MTWQRHDSYGCDNHESLLNITALCVDEEGVIECQVRPVTWEYICRELGNSRPVTTDFVDNKASFTSCVAGRVLRFYAVNETGLDFRFRVVSK